MKQTTWSTSGLWESPYLTDNHEGLRIQAYWPEITYHGRPDYDLIVMARTCIRITYQPEIRYYGFGLSILGFGLGWDYQGP
jgi:hypothetical protein